MRPTTLAYHLRRKSVGLRNGELSPKLRGELERAERGEIKGLGDMDLDIIAEAFTFVHELNELWKDIEKSARMFMGHVEWLRRLIEDVVRSRLKR